MKPIKRVLLATDFSPASEKAAEHAAVIAASQEAELHVLYVHVLLEDIWGRRGYPDYEQYEQELGQAAESRLSEVADRPPLKVIRATERDVSAADAILRYTDQHKIDLIVIGTHSRKAVARMFLGSVASNVIRAAPVSVLAVGPHHKLDDYPYGTILAAVDFSPSSFEALRRAGSLAHAFNSKLVVMHVVDDTKLPPYYPQEFEKVERKRAQQVLDDMLATAAIAASATPVVTVGDPFACVIGQARDHDAGLIVMGTVGLRGLRRMLIGSVTERVLRNPPCPVWACRCQEAGESG